MKILQFTQTLLKFSAVLPMFSTSSFMGKIRETLKFIAIILPPFYGATSTFAFTLIHIDNLRLVSLSMLVCLGTLTGFFLIISFSLKTNSVTYLLKDIESLANKSKCCFHSERVIL